MCCGRLDPIVDLKSEMLVTRSYQCLANCGSAFPNWQGFPIPGFRLCNQSIELVLPFKDRPERQARFRCERDRPKQRQRDQQLPTSHDGTTQAEMDKVTRLKSQLKR